MPSRTATTFARLWRTPALAGSLAALAGAATADGIARVELSAEGRLLFGASDDFGVGVQPIMLGPGATRYTADEVREDSGGGGALAARVFLPGGWFLGAGVQYDRLTGDGGSDQAAYLYSSQFPIQGVPGFYSALVDDFTTDIESSYTAVDFEVGQEFGLGSGQLALFGGLRVAWLERDIDVLGNLYQTPGYTAGFERKNRFFGAGPRIGASFVQPLGAGFGLLAEASGAVLFGRVETDEVFTAYDGPLNTAAPVTSRHRDESQSVWSAEAAAALTYSLAASLDLPVALAVGYRFEGLFGAVDNDNDFTPPNPAPASGGTHDSFMTHGPFVRLTVSF